MCLESRVVAGGVLDLFQVHDGVIRNGDHSPLGRPGSDLRLPGRPNIPTDLELGPVQTLYRSAEGLEERIRWIEEVDRLGAVMMLALMGNGLGVKRLPSG
jgi:hypothetical protein